MDFIYFIFSNISIYYCLMVLRYKYMYQIGSDWIE